MREFENLGISEGVEATAKLYNDIAVRAENLVSESYASARRKVSFPIDINVVAKHLGIKVDKEHLNLDGVVNFSRKLGVVTSASDGGVRIVVDDAVSYKTQRYAIANGVGRYLLNDSKAIFKNTYAIPLIPQSLDEIAADSIAVFLLMPVTTFKDEFLQYLIMHKEYPMDVDVWLGHLSDKCQITPFNLAIGYQQMKQVLCYQRQVEFEKNDYDIGRMREDKYDRIFA